MPDPSPVGQLLAYWRKARHKSQLALALEADVSPRHVCFIETGRARPSRDMLILLAGVLDVPFRERNALLIAGGFAPIYREPGLGDPELAAVRAALDAILRQQRPFPAVVMNRCWDLVQVNDAAERFFAMLLAGSSPPGPPNVLRLMFHPDGARPHVRNWEAVAETLIRRAHREAVGGVEDAALRAVLDEVLAYPGVPRRWQQPPAERAAVPVIPVCFEKAGRRYAYFSTVTTLGTPQDVTAQELRIECFFPADDDTDRLARAESPC